ncbi:MAG TPA: biotin--[acetyl-CoA-carboxylase] ligase [Clostridia bacterium]|nr:biotin--[acetyl-CoA-carboxylase] ligase [Clostridia bacterium]
MKYKILRRLKEAEPGYVSGGELGKLLEVSRTAIWKYIAELRQEGYMIEASSRKGYRLLPSEQTLNSYEIAEGLDTAVIGRKVEYYDSVDSTNNLAKIRAAAGCDDGTAIVAGCQTAGRGRLGRGWESPPGKGIYISVVLRPDMAPAETQILTLAAAVAAADAIKASTGIETGIKWPNDLVIEGRKVCGILLEMSSEADSVNYLVLGIGINFSHDRGDFSDELKEKAVSLRMAASNIGLDKEKQFGKLSVIRAILYEMDRIYRLILDGGQEQVLERWRKQTVTLGRTVSFKLQGSDYSGTVVDITSDGKLSVECLDGVRRDLYSGEVSVSGMYY